MTITTNKSKVIAPVPLVTVAMPVYNAGKFLRPAVLSILMQSYQSWELLIMDDGSTDGAMDTIADIVDVRIRICSDGQNRGIAVRLNEAIDMARGRYFARMDSDDVSYPERFSRQVHALQSNSGLDLLATSAIAIGENDQVLSVFPRALTHEQICRQPWRGFFLPHPSWMGKIEWFREFRYKVPATYCSEDQELLLRSYHRSRFATLPEVQFAYRIRSKVDYAKLFKTRRAVLIFQQSIFLKNQQWIYYILSLVAFVIRVGIDFIKHFLLNRSTLQWRAASQEVVDEWWNVWGGVIAASKSL